ncbi:MAG: glycosyltransferase family 4 protein [Actinomycetota bacterium]
MRYLANHPPSGYVTAGVIGGSESREYFSGLPFEQWGTRRPWNHFEPDLLHAHGLTAGLQAIRSAGIGTHRPAVVVTVHTSMQQTLRSGLPGSGQPAVQRTIWSAARLLLARCDAVIGVSEEVGWQVRATAVVPPAVDLALAAPVPRLQVRSELRTAPDRLVVLATGRLHPDKSLHVLLDALAGQEADGWIAGDGPEREHLEELAKGTSVRLLGHRDDIGSLLGAADLFALPTAAESYGFAVMEAVAAGLPVLSTRTGSIPEIVADAGILVNPNDPAGFARALHRLIASPELREELAARARRRKLPSPAELVERVGEVYNNALAGRLPAPKS